MNNIFGHLYSYGNSASNWMQQQVRVQDLQHLIRKWGPSSQRKTPPKDSLKLSGPEKFGDAFDAALGNENVADIYGPEDDRLTVAVFEALLENEAQRQFYCESNQLLEQLLCVGDSACEITVWGSGENRIWKIIGNNYEEDSFVDLVRRIFTISRKDAIATLAGVIGMKYENITQLSSSAHVAEKQNLKPFNTIPDCLSLPHNRSPAKRELSGFIRGNSGQVIGAIAQYKMEGTSFCLPATVGRGTLSIGQHSASAFFIDQDKMDTQPFDKILLCQDVRTAMKLQKILSEARHASKLPAIVTGHLFDDLSVLPWNYFSGHDVVFVPAPNKACMAMSKAYKRYAMAGGAKSFRVATHVLLHASPNCNLNNLDNRELTGIEAELIGKSTLLEDVERPTALLNQIWDSAISYDEYVAWGMGNGIFQREKQFNSPRQQKKSHVFKIFDPDALAPFSQSAHIWDVTLQHVISGIIMIHGIKNAGKSTLIFAIIRGLVFGEEACGFKAEGGPAKVMLLDSETLPGVLSEKIRANGLKNSIGINFFPVSKQDILSSEKENIALTNEAFLLELEGEVIRKNIEYLILDNLTSLTDPGSIYLQITTGEILDWAAKCTARGTTVMMLHHSSDGKDPKAAEMRGSKEFSIQAHTEIVVIGREQILENKALGDEKVKASAGSGDGTTLGIHFKVCKQACVLEGHTFWFHIPLQETLSWNLLAVTNREDKPVDIPFASSGPDLEKIAPEAHPVNDCVCNDDKAELDEKTGEVENSACLNSQLSEDERKIMEEAHKNGKIVVSTVCNLLPCAETKARGLLNELVGKDELVKLKEKQGCPTVYGPA